MNPPTREFSPGENQQGPRPSALKESRKIRKSVVVPQREDFKPLIIYDIEPRVIHTTANDFKRVVQLLTGMPTTRADGRPPPRPIKNREISGAPSPVLPGLFFSAPLDLGSLDPYICQSMVSDPTLSSSPSSSSADLSNPFFDI